MAIRLSKDLNKIELHDMFADLKVYEFELETSTKVESTSKVTQTLIATFIESLVSKEKSVENYVVMLCHYS